jgi:hypothetical protein
MTQLPSFGMLGPPLRAIMCFIHHAIAVSDWAHGTYEAESVIIVKGIGNYISIIVSSMCRAFRVHLELSFKWRYFSTRGNS